MVVAVISGIVGAVFALIIVVPDLPREKQALEDQVAILTGQINGCRETIARQNELEDRLRDE